MRRLIGPPRVALLLGVAAAAYSVAAWSVRPGFYDGFSPPQPYNWVSPPPGVKNGGPARSAHLEVQVLNGVVEPGTCFTDDGQFILSFVPGAFAPPVGGGPVIIDVQPASAFPAPTGFAAATNVYLVKVNSSLIKPAVVTMRYSDLIAAPGFIYQSDGEGGPWRNIGSSGVSAPFSIAQRTTRLGYFVAGVPTQHASGSSPTVGGGQSLPIIVAIVIVIVILAGIPLALMRRRSEDEDPGPQ